MKKLITYLSKKSLSLGNGSGMTRKWFGNDSGMTRFSLASLICLCMLTIGVGNAWGTDVTFTVNVESSNTTTMSKGDVTVSTTSGTFSRTDNYRIYANNSMTISSSGGNITKVVFTVSQNTFTANVGTWTDGTKTWTGDASSITFSASGGQVRLTKIVVTTAGGGSSCDICEYYVYNGSSFVKIGETADDEVVLTPPDLSSSGYYYPSTYGTWSVYGSDFVTKMGACATYADNDEDEYRFVDNPGGASPDEENMPSGACKLYAVYMNGSGCYTTTASAPACVRFVQPQNLTSNVVGDDVTLSWTDYSPEAPDEYYLYVTDGVNDVFDGTVTSASKTLNDLPAGDYIWSVYGVSDVNTKCDSEVNDEGEFTIIGCTDISSSTVTGVSVTPSKVGGSATWTAVANATSYEVKVYAGTATSGVALFSAEPTSNSCTITGLSASTQYTVVVKAKNSCSTSNQGTATWTTSALTLYTVTFVNQSGAAVSPATQITEDGSVTLPSASPSAACAALGWTFAGWKDGSAQTETTSAPTLIAAGSYTPSGNKTFYAVYTMTESGGGTPKTTLLSDDFSDITTGTNTSTTGQTLWDGGTLWTSLTNATGADGMVKLGGKSSTGSFTAKNALSVASGTTITIRLKVKGWSSVEGNIVVSADNGAFTNQSYSYTATMSSDETEEVSSSVVLSKANPTITVATSAKRAFVDEIEIYYGGGGSSTTYWNSNPSCSSTASVTYDGNGNTGGTAPTDVNNPYTIGDEVIVLACPNTLVKTGKVFGCWNTQSDGLGTDYAPGATFDISGDITLYAKWVNPPYTVTFNAEGGTCGTSSLTEASGGAGVTLPEAVSTCSEWSFAGWKESAQSETSTDISSSLYEAGSTYYPSTDNVELHAVYATYGSGSNTTFAVVNNTMTAVQNGYYVITYNRAATLYALGSSAYVINPSTGRSGVASIEVPSTSAASSATLSSKDPVWQFINVSGSNYRIRNYKTGQYLKATDNNNELIFSATADDNYSLWTITCTTEDNNANTNTIKNVATNDYLIKYSSANCYVSQGTTPQVLYFYRVTTAPVFGSATYNSNPSCPTHEVTIGSHTNGTIEVNGLTDSPQTVEDGNTVEITATPESGYNFTTWTITKTTGGNDVTSTLLGANATTASTSFTMPDYDVTVSATFTAKVMCTITWNVNGSTYTTGDPSTSAESGTKWSALTLPTAPADNTLSDCDRTKFVGWSTSQLFGDGNSAPSDLFKSTSDDNADSHTITGTTTFYAVFAKGSGDFSFGWESADDASIWTISGFCSKETYNDYKKTGSYAGSIQGTSGYIQLTDKISPTSISCQYTKASTNTNNSSKFIIQTSSNGSDWTDQATGKTMNNVTQGTFEELKWTGSLSDVYVRVYYTGTSAVRVLDDVVISGGSFTDYATQCCTLKPVTNLAVSSTTANSVTLTWTAPSPTTGIDHLELRNASTDAKIGSNIAVGTTTTSVSGLVECNTYSYKIVSVGAVCETPSDVVEATPFGGSKTVTFNYNGGTGTPASFTTSCDGTSTTLPTPDARDGYTFLGWWSAQNGGIKKGDAGDNYDVTGNTTIWAHWAQNFTVTYDLNGGAADPICSGGTYYVGQSVTVCSTTPTKTSSSFLGWKRLDTDATVAGGSTFTMPSNNVTIQAQWETVYFHIYYKEEDGTAIATDDVPQTAETTLRNQTPCVGYTFFGWSTSKITTETTSKPAIIGKGGASYTPEEDITVYPVYARVEGASDKNDVITKDINGGSGSYTAFSNVSYVSDAKYAGCTTVQSSTDLSFNASNGIVTTTSGGRIKHVQVVFATGCTQPRSLYVYGKNSAYSTFEKDAFPTGASAGTLIATATKTTLINTGEVTVELPAADTDFEDEYNYIALGADNSLRITSIKVTWSAGTTYYATHCETKTDVTITYDANGGTTTCGNGSHQVTWDYADGGAGAPTLASAQTICASATRSGGYILRDWTTSQDGTGTHYTPGQTVTSMDGDKTLYAQWDRVYTVTFNNQGVTTPVTQASEGATIAVPSASSACSAEWAFVGWSETEIAPMSLLPTLEITAGTSTYTPTADKTLYAIYRKTSTSDAFVAGMSGAYKIKATKSATDYYATTAGAKLDKSTNSAEAVTYYIKYSSADGGKYTIQRNDGKYIAYKGKPASVGAHTDLQVSDDVFYWRISSAGGGLWAVQSPTSTDANTRYLQLDNEANPPTGFKAYHNGINIAFVATEGQYYYRTMSCEDEFDITFHDNGTTINWADGHPEATYKDLADATVVTTFPTATFDGWTFLGWRTADYAESTTAPASSGIFGGSNGTSGNALTIASANVDLYPVFTRFEDNEPFDQINGGDYYIYFLDEGSDDGYGAAQRVYAASYESYKRYNSSALCSAATTFTFTKLDNGNWTIYDNTTNKYLYGIENDDLKQQASATGAEWTLTVNGNQFDAFHVGTSYGQLIAQGDGTSATFMNYRRTNVTTNPAMYHRVYLGSCTNRTFTTNPSTTPEIDLKGTAVVTASQNGAVRGTNVLTVSGHNLTPSTGEITIASDNSDVYFSKTTAESFAAGIAASSNPQSSITVTANSSGIVTPTSIYVHYKPSSNVDAVTDVTVTATYSGADDATTTIKVRSVKENFAIAAKIANSWYALPANMSSSDVYTPTLIEVDESSNVAYGPSTVAYKLWPVKTTNGSGNRYAAVGDEVRFTGNSDNALWANNAASGTTTGIRNWAVVNSIDDGGSGSGEDLDERYEWVISTEDGDAYTINTNQSNNKRNLVIYRKNGQLVWATNGSYETNEIHLIPLTERQVIEIIPREWKSNGLVFAIDADNLVATSGTYKIGTGDEASATYSRRSTGGYGLYEVTLPALASHYGKVLTLKMTINSVVTYAYVTIPIIVSGTTTTTTAETPFTTLGTASKNYDVVLLDGAKLTTDATASGAHAFQNFYVYPGATWVNNNGSTSFSYLELRGGIKGIDARDSHAQGVPHVLLNKAVSSTAGANLDMTVYTDHGYALSVPFNVDLSKVNFANSLKPGTGAQVNGTLASQFFIRKYDGEVRANNGRGGWVDITPAENKTIHAGEGYTLQGKRPKGQPFAVIRFPFTGVNSWADGGGEVAKANIPIYAYAGGATTPDNDKGWNLIANPYMATISYDTDDELSWAASFKVGNLVKTDGVNWDGKYQWKNANQAYVTIPNDSYTEFPQTRASKATFEPFKNFFIQTTSDGVVAFVRSDRHDMPRYLMAQTEQETPIYADINLAHGDQSAQAGLTIDADATTGYTFGEDYTIFESREALTYLKVYTVADGHYLVGNTLTPAETAELIPVEFYAPNAEGEYIFSLDANSDIDRLEYVILYDAELGLNTNLLTNDYTVELEQTGLIENRFSIGLKVKEKDNSATGIDDVGDDSERPYKFLYRDKMYILRGGKIYDATGKQVREINK